MVAAVAVLAEFGTRAIAMVDVPPRSTTMVSALAIDGAAMTIAPIRTRTIAVVITATLDHNGLGARNRRRRDDDRTKCSDNVSKPSS